MGIDFEIIEIAPNPGKRAVARICLNSLQGKFEQRLNLAQTEYIVDVKRRHENDKLDVSSCLFINDNMDQLTYIASFTTSNAPLRFYAMLARLREKVVYMNTDSCCFIDTENALPSDACDDRRTRQ